MVKDPYILLNKLRDHYLPKLKKKAEETDNPKHIQNHEFFLTLHDNCKFALSGTLNYEFRIILDEVINKIKDTLTRDDTKEMKETITFLIKEYEKRFRVPEK